MDIELGQEVKCKITGFKGIAVSKTIFINGCVQYSIAPKWDKKKGGHPVEQEVGIDASSLKLTNKPKKKVEKSDTGGPNRFGVKQRGY